MQPALSTTIAPLPIPVWGELSENSCQGFATQNPAWNPGPNTVNSTTAIGFWASLCLETIRQSHSARYYNPLTGRFMSRDPEEHGPKAPNELNKYIYASDDPVDLLDPSGRADAEEEPGGASVAIEFGHGARHVLGAGMNPAQVEAVIEAAVRQIIASGATLGNWWGVVNVVGIPITYRAYVLSAILIKIGTYTIGH